MKTRKLGIMLDQGSDFNLVIQVSGESGPIDITGYSFKGQMRESTDPASPVVAEFIFTILDQVLNKGQVSWVLPEAESDESEIPTSISTALQKRRQTTPFVFDVKMKDVAGTISRIIQGIIYVSPQASQESI